MAGVLRLANVATGGSVTLDPQSPNNHYTVTLPNENVAMPMMRLSTAKTATGTAVDFTDVPAWAKKITVMFNGVSLSGTSHFLLQLGSGAFLTSGYVSASNVINQVSQTGGIEATNGFGVYVATASYAVALKVEFLLVSSNSYISTHSGRIASANILSGAGNVSLGGVLDRIRITTVNGTDTFDAGSINILYEGY